MILNGNALRIPLADCSVQTCVTSPPYFGLRDYGVAGQIGLEQTPAEYVAQLVTVFREVWRVLKDDGTLWLNLGDSYAADRGGTTPPAQTVAGGVNGQGDFAARRGMKDGYNPSRNAPAMGLKHKDLIGIPWRVAFALQAEGWYLRSDIIWSKPNPMPESVTDRPTRAHEYIFLLSKSARYWYDSDAIKEQSVYAGGGEFSSRYATAQVNRGGESNWQRPDKQRGHSRRHAGFNDRWDGMTKAEQAAMGRNKRSVWTVATKPYSGAHFATFPPELITPCILAGAPEGGIVFDPFSGSGTTVATARQLGRVGIGIELNTEYIGLAQERNQQMTVWEAQS